MLNKKKGKSKLEINNLTHEAVIKLQNLLSLLVFKTDSSEKSSENESE